MVAAVMCGRFTQARSWSELVELYRVTEIPTPSNLPPRYNVAPTDAVAVVRPVASPSVGPSTRIDTGSPDSAGERELVLIRWGLIPFWAKDTKIGARMINARAEGVAEKPAFRDAFKRRRCLVVADGFYEWRKDANARQPFHITPADARPFAFAGLWEAWAPPGGQRLDSCTIITTEANAALAPLHDRMPVMLEPAQFEAWLDPDRPGDEARALLRPYGGALSVQPVSTRVNNVRNDDAECIQPLASSLTTVTPEPE